MPAPSSARARVRGLFVLCLLLVSGARAASAQEARLPAEKVRQIEALISAEMAKQKIPGLSVAVVTDRQLRWSSGYGLSDVENNVAAKASTVYRLASISKPITATAVMQLFERGRVDLDAPVQKYCPAFPEKQWPVTTREVLAHLSGIRHYKSDEEFNSTRHFATVVESLEMFKNDPLLHEPGVKMTYSTFGYTLLGVGLFVPIVGGLYVERTTNTAALTSVAAGLSVMLIDRALTGGAEPGLVTPAVAGLLAALGVWAIMLPFSKLSRTQPTK